MCVGGGHRCSPHTGTLCSLALALIGRPHHGGSVGASVRLHSQFHHRSVRVCVWVCVCVCLQALCLSEGTESHAIRTGQHCLPWLPLSNIVSHCLPPVPACLPVTIDRLLWQQVPDQEEMMYGKLNLCWLPHVFGSNSKILSTGNAQFMWLMHVCNRNLYHQEVLVHA